MRRVWLHCWRKSRAEFALRIKRGRGLRSRGGLLGLKSLAIRITLHLWVPETAVGTKAQLSDYLIQYRSGPFVYNFRVKTSTKNVWKICSSTGSYLSFVNLNSIWLGFSWCDYSFNFTILQYNYAASTERVSVSPTALDCYVEILVSYIPLCLWW
jgi:hypothetical protein